MKESDESDATLVGRSAPRPLPEAASDVNTTVLVRTESPRRGPAGPEERAHYLAVIAGAGAGLRIELGTKPVVIGRQTPADVVLVDERISRRHCRVGVVLDEVFLTDLGSSNGTFVDGRAVEGNVLLPPGARVQIGGHVLEHEWRLRREVEASREQDEDLESAGRYVRSLLPKPLTDGPVRTEWALLPCAHLGGDVFGYHYLDARTFAIYLIDVSGHGTGPAMHAVSVINVLRQPAIPGVDLRDPCQVAAHLNAMFPMSQHGEMFFTLWYGVCDLDARCLRYCSAGHHPALLAPATRDRALPLRTRNVAIGIKAGHRFTADEVRFAPGSRLYVFSDGIFEVETPGGGQLGLDAAAGLMQEQPIVGIPEPERLLQEIRARAASPEFDDDFTLVVATLP